MARKVTMEDLKDLNRAGDNRGSQCLDISDHRLCVEKEIFASVGKHEEGKIVASSIYSELQYSQLRV